MIEADSALRALTADDRAWLDSMRRPVEGSGCPPWRPRLTLDMLAADIRRRLDAIAQAEATKERSR